MSETFFSSYYFSFHETVQMLCSYIYKIPESSLRANYTERFPPPSLEIHLSLTFLHLEFFKICAYSEICQANSQMAEINLTLHRFGRHTVGWRYSSTHCFPRHLAVMNGQLYNLTILLPPHTPRERTPDTHWIESWSVRLMESATYCRKSISCNWISQSSPSVQCCPKIHQE